MKRGARAYPSTIPPDRVSHVALGEPEGPTSGAAKQRDGFAEWLDRLLVVATELPRGGGGEAAVVALVDAVKDILAPYAVGACFVPAPGAGGQLVVKRAPPGDDERAEGTDPTRLFPRYEHECIVELAGAARGSTLHVAADEPSLGEDGSPALHLLRRAGALLERALEDARAHDAASEADRRAKALEAHVIQADKLASFGQIAAGLVHELNNPLTSIVAYSDYLIRKEVGRGDASDPDDVERLRRISESAHRMLRFTRDLVTYARPSGERAFPVVLHAAIDQAVAFCDHVREEAHATIERRYGADILTVRALPEQLVQVFVNLITNACHALPEAGGIVTLTTELVPASSPGGARYVVVVEDNGHGIAEEHQAQVFAPFFTTKRDGRGTGLGLSIVKSIVQNHGGDIRLDPGSAVGCRFVITLPVGR